MSVIAEQSVLGAILLDSGVLGEVRERINDTHWHEDRHRLIYRLICEMQDDGKEVDIVTVTSEIIERGLGIEPLYVAKLPELIPCSESIPAWLDIMEKTGRRRVVGKIHELTREWSRANPEEIASQVEELLSGLRTGNEKRGWKTLGAYIHEEIADLDRRRKACLSGGVAGMKCGISDLDWAINGFHAKLVYGIAARPAMGKTALLLNLMAGLASNGFPGGYFSLEMPGQQNAQRLLSAESRVDIDNILRGDIDIRSDDWRRYSDAAERLSQLPVYIDDSPATLSQVRGRIRRLKSMKPGIKWIALDYLQIISSEKDKTREQEVNAFAKTLKEMAKDYEVSMIPLIQLNRGVETRQDKRPMMSDVRDSGGIEEAMDVLLGLYRDEYYNTETENSGICEVLMLKNRFGKSGSGAVVKLLWNGKFQRFDCLDSRYDDVEPEYGNWR